MRKGKLYRFKAIKQMDHVHEYPENSAGNWNHYFGREAPLVLELACGRGEYSIGMAQIHPQNNYLGVDIKGERIYVGARKVKQEGLDYVHFLRTQIEKIDSYFNEGEVDDIWLPFPDPQIRYSNRRRRLTHPIFLKKYQHILKKQGSVHLKTDSPHLYQFTKGVIQFFNLSLLEDIDNIYKLDNVKEVLKIETHYQKLDIANQQKVHYLRFQLDQPISENIETDFLEFINNQMNPLLTEH